MSRPLRIEYPDAFYHVMNRGAGRREIFSTDDDYAMFLETLKETAGLSELRVLSFCLMPNHYHLLVQTPKTNLSRTMRHLNGVYTQRFNRLHKKDGPLFRGRYKAILVQEDAYLTHLVRYIHLNPIAANLTSNLSRYPWTSHGQYLKAQDQKPWLHVRFGLAFFADNLGQALKSYRSFVSQGVDPMTQSFYDKKRQNPIFGDADFLKNIKEKYILGHRKLDTEIPHKRRLAGSVLADRIIQEISRVFSVSAKDLLGSRRGLSNPARLAALALTRELSGLKLSEIADVFQISSYRTVGTSCYRWKQLLKRRGDLSRKYEGARRTCSQGKT